MSNEKNDSTQKINGLKKELVHKDVLESSDSALAAIEGFEFPALDSLETAKQGTVLTEGLSPFTSWLLSLGAPSSAAEFQDVNTTVEMHQSQTAPYRDANLQAAPVDFKKKKKKKRKDKVKAKKQDKKKKKGKKKKAKSASDADDGVLLAPDIYSETLAEILESQGYIEQAIEMYQKLNLKYPDKSRFFAARIEKLREQNR